MRTITLAAATLAVLTTLSPAAAAPSGSDGGPPTLAVSGQGSIDRTPDRVTLSFGIVTNDDVAARATSANNPAYNALAARLSGARPGPGGAQDDLVQRVLQPAPGAAQPAFAQRYGYVVSR